MSSQNQPISTPVLYILIVLAVRELHGYGIMRAVESQTDGRISLGPGTLYTALKRLIEQGLVEQSRIGTDSDLDDERRKYYRLTDAGRSLLASETSKIEQTALHARKALGGLSPVVVG